MNLRHLSCPARAFQKLCRHLGDGRSLFLYMILCNLSIDSERQIWIFLINYSARQDRGTLERLTLKTIFGPKGVLSIDKSVISPARSGGKLCEFFVPQNTVRIEDYGRPFTFTTFQTIALLRPIILLSSLSDSRRERSKAEERHQFVS